jgi:pimeloyl-ACP methyl ester carboxylesterase
LAPQLVELPSGLRLEYVESGSPTGLPLVFLHGVTDSWRSFELLLPLLPSAFRALALSQRGHGRSSRPAAGYDYADFAGDVLGFLDALGLERVVLVGHSMGSLVAQRFCADHPERVAGLGLLGAFRTLHRDAAIAEFVAAAIAPLRDPIDPGFAREWQQSTLARPIPPAFLETVVAETLAVPARVWHATFDAFLRTPDFGHLLAGLRVPTLVAWGDRDAYAPRAQQEALLAALPHARLSIHAGAGHALHWEDPERVGREVAELAESVALRVATTGRVQSEAASR